MKNILVLGGSGFVGRHLCEKLTRLGWQITVPTRRPDAAKHLITLPRLTLRQADVNKPDELKALLPGHDAVVNLVAILHGDQPAFTRAHVTLPTQLASACRDAGVKRLVHVSALGAASDAPSMYQRSKAAGEVALQSAGLDLTVLRPSVIFGRDDRFVNLFASLQSLFPFIPLAGANTRFQPVWVEDVAQALVNCLLQPDTVGQVYEACGPDVMTLREIVQLAGRCRGHDKPVFNLPPALARLQARLMEMAPGAPLMSRDNLDSMKVDNVASGHGPGLAHLGISPASLKALAPLWLR